jgi:hypothetical protein
MPYPESCPECGSAFRNTGTHYTTRRNEAGRHVLLELGCQTTSRRFWWNFTTGQLVGDGRVARPASSEALASTVAAASNGAHARATNGFSGVSTIERKVSVAPVTDPPQPDEPADKTHAAETPKAHDQRPAELLETASFASDSPAPPALKEAFIRQLQLDRLTLRQMRSWLMADDARRAIEVAAGATEATYERLALILFGTDLPQLLGKQTPPAAPPSMSAEERLELQREKARIRARLRRAAIKAARQNSST